jgi:hypothetical protein
MPLARNACFSASVKLLSFTPRYGQSLESDLPQRKVDVSSQNALMELVRGLAKEEGA